MTNQNGVKQKIYHIRNGTVLMKEPSQIASVTNYSQANIEAVRNLKISDQSIPRLMNYYSTAPEDFKAKVRIDP